MNQVYSVNFYCHGCGIENTFNFQCDGDQFDAVTMASNFCCPSGCNPKRTVFELTYMQQVDWVLAVEAATAVFH